jgi:adenylate cyclase
MHPVKRFITKNALIGANFLVNAIGVPVVDFLAAGITRLPSMDFEDIAYQKIDPIFIPLAFGIAIGCILLYERPIRDYLNKRFQGLEVTPELERRARRKLLNEPFFLIGLNAIIWIAAAITYPLFFWKMGMGFEMVTSALFFSLQVGLMTVTVAFFVNEFILQRRLAPIFFPRGGLSAIQGTIRIRIRMRLIMFLVAANLIPMISFLRSSWRISLSAVDPGEAFWAMHATILSGAVIFAGGAIWLTFLVSSNLTQPLESMTAALKRIREGHFNTRVTVVSNDELGYVGDAINEMAAGLKEREFIKETFGKYVSSEVRDEVLSRRIPLDGEFKDVTVVFADLRDYTPLVEKTTPRKVVRIINCYFEEMEKAIRAHGGLVVQFIGDEIEAVFGAPIALADHATCAVLAAMQMHAGLEKVNRDLALEGHQPLQHGIGVHSGQVVAANIGSPSRMSYALVGDTVNVASRLQGLNKQYGTRIIISAETFNRLSRRIPTQLLPDTQLKGKAEPMQLFAVVQGG